MTTEHGDEQQCTSAEGAHGAIDDCSDAVRQLYNFLDNELTDDLREAFEAHLNACGPCVEIVSFEAELRRVIANKCQDRVPEELRTRIAALIMRESSNRQ